MSESISQPFTSAAQSDHIPLVDSTLTDPALLRSCNKNIGKVLYMGTCFLVIFTAFSSANNIVSEIYDQLDYESLGQLSSFVLNLATLPVMIFPGFINQFSIKNSVFVGSLGFIFTLSAGALTTICAEDPTYSWCQKRSYIYTINIILSVIAGLFSGVIWIALNRYITACSNGANEGRFLGIFAAVFSCSNVTGSIIAAFVLKHFGQFNFFLVACVISILSIFMVYFAPEVDRYDKEDEQLGFKEQSIRVIKLSFNPRMRTFLLFLIFVGIITAIYTGFEYRIILHAIPKMSKEDQNAITSWVFMVQGVSTIIFSYVVGDLADMFKLSYVLNGFLMMNFVAIGLSYLSFYLESLILAYVMAAVWGLTISSACNLTGIVMMKDWNGSLESFALLQFVNNVGIVFGYVMCIYMVDVVTFLNVLLGILIITQISTLLYKSKDIKN